MLRKTLIGLFENHEHADRTIHDLTSLGVAANKISVLVHDYAASRFVHQQSTGAAVAGGTTAGLETGAVIGGVLGLLVGVAGITIPELGPIFVAGPLAALLGLTGTAASTVGGAVSGAIAGGLIGVLVGIGVPEMEAQLYEELIKQGHVMVAVDLDETTVDEETARTAFEHHGGKNIYQIRRE